MSNKIESSKSKSPSPRSSLLSPTMAETEQSQLNTAVSSDKSSSFSFSIWPPTDRTRDAVRNRLIETLSTPSILSKRYGTVSHDEAVESAKLIEQEAFEVAGIVAHADDDGIEILQMYSKEISRRILESVKARSGDSAADQPHKAAEEEDAGSSAPPQSENTESLAGDE